MAQMMTHCTQKPKESSPHKWNTNDYPFNNVLIEYKTQATCILWSSLCCNLRKLPV